jgi:hypothetical protein
VVPITPAKPKAPTRPTKPKQKPTFASRQIDASHNKQSAAVLFTPYIRHAGVGNSVRELQPSPSLRQAARLPAQNVPLRLGSKTLSLADDDVEEELREGLDRLNFEPSSDSQSDAGSGSLTSQAIPPSRSVSPSHSHPQNPHAGPHSKHRKAAVKPRVGAKDVWTFFAELNEQRECVFCQ